MKKMFVGNLPPDANEESVRNMFSAHGTVRSIQLVTDIFSGTCKGFGSVEMEGHEAVLAQAALDGNMVQGTDRFLRVSFQEPRSGRGRKRK